VADGGSEPAVKRIARPCDANGSAASSRLRDAPAGRGSGLKGVADTALKNANAGEHLRTSRREVSTLLLSRQRCQCRGPQIVLLGPKIVRMPLLTVLPAATLVPIRVSGCARSAT
jgi:hypothetical protein